VTVVPDVVTTIIGGVNAVVAGDGTLAYVSGTLEGTLRWVDKACAGGSGQEPPRF
jgi:hypothetical protein